VRQLQDDYPRNPLFRQIEAEILDTYSHDAAASLAASERLLAMAKSGQVNRPDIASTVARLNIARQSIALQQRDRATVALDSLIAEHADAPYGALARARELRRSIR